MTVRRPLVLLAAVLVAVVVVRARRPQPPAASSRPPASEAGSPTAARAAAATPGDADARATVPGRPRSLRGTRVDGGLGVDGDGRFVPGPDARRLFDYFLTASGEEPAERTRARIQAEIARRLPPAAAADAAALLDRYLEYQARARTLEADGDLAARAEALARLRRDVLGAADSQALFGDEERIVVGVAETARIMADQSLSADERAEKLAALDAALPPAARDARARALLPLQLAEAEAALRAQDASDEAIRALREQLVGPEAADRLAALDRRRAEWQGRVDAFRAARHAIETDDTLDPASRGRRIQELLAERFTPAERLRVQTLDAGR